MHSDRGSINEGVLWFRRTAWLLHRYDVTDCIFLVGHNMASTQTVLRARVLDRLAGPDPPKVVVIDPRKCHTAEKATVHLALKIGTNMAVLNGIMHLLFKHDWIDHDYLAKHVVGLERLRSKVEKYNRDLVEKITGIRRSELELAARILGQTRSLLSTALQGVYQSNQATASACQINNINLLRGLIGKPGSGIFQMNGQPTAQNNRESGCDGEYPGFRNFSNPDHMREMADIWNVDYQHIPHWNQPTHIHNMLKYISAGTIQMFWISGTNPLVSLHDLPRARKLLTRPDLFVICQDIFMTETAAIADVVLPAAQWGEKIGCFTNVDRTVHLSHKAIDPPGEAKSDLEIWIDYARRMQFKDKSGNPLIPWKTAEEVFEQWKRMSAGRSCDYTGLTYEKLTGGSGIQWPYNSEHPQGTERLFTDGNFYTDIEYCESNGHDLETGAPYSKDQYRAINPGGRAFLKSADYLPGLEEPSAEYPLQLSTGRNVYHFHTRTKTGRSKALQDAAPSPLVTLAQSDALARVIQEGDMVLVTSRRGAIEIAASIGDIKPGQVFIPFHYGYWDSNDGRARAANELTDEQWDPISKQPMFKSGAVEIRKCSSITSGSVGVGVSDSRSKAGGPQRDLLKAVQQSKPEAASISDASPRKMFLDDWLETTLDAIDILLEVCDRLLPALVQDLEVSEGMQVMRRIAERVRNTMMPFERRAEDEAGEETTYGESLAALLRDRPPRKKRVSPQSTDRPIRAGTRAMRA